MTILEKKLKAVETFKNEFLKTKEGKGVAKIILFGSTAKGTATPESDIDLLVIALDNLKVVENTADKIAYQIMLDSGEVLEPMVYCIDALKYVDSYFIYQVLKTGKEVFKMNEKEIIRGEIKSYLDLARDYLESAQLCLKANKFRFATDAAYNAAELCAKGFLLLKMKELPKTHGGVVEKFSEYFVKTNILLEKFGRGLNRGIRFRNKARYDAHTEITREITEEVMDLANSLIEELAKSLA